MRHRPTLWHSRLGSVVLAMLLLGAYVPVGYMPADGAPFRVELCPTASPLPATDADRDMAAAMARGVRMDMSAGATAPVHRHPGGHEHVCPFGSAPGAGPLASLPPFCAAPRPAPATLAPPAAVLAQRALLTHQARGPPLLLI